MVNVEPYEYQKKTNLKEHNDLVAKINEIVDVINNTNLDTITPKITKLEQDVSEITAKDGVQDNDISSLKTKTAKLETDVSVINDTDSLQWQDIESVKGDIGTITQKITKLEQDVTDINTTDAVQNTDIGNLKAKDSEHDSHLGTIDTEINGITKSLVSDVAILTGTTNGNVKVRIGRMDTPSIVSNDYNIQKPTSVELVQGSAPAMVKAQITLSDGTVLVSDDFMFTTEAIGQDVYISSFVFKNGNVAGTISADIGLSNGSTLTANNFAVPTDPNVTSSISDIQGRLTTVENDTDGLKTTVNGHTTAINDLNSDVSGLKTTVNGHTTAINGLNSDVSGLKTTVNGHTTAINTLDSDVTNLMMTKADVDNTNQSIVAGSISATNIKKGGVNVATVNDIPVVPDISSKADLNNSSQTIIAGTINATNINKNGVAVATSNDIPDISGKVDIAQGTANAGKVLGIGSDGNVTPTEVSAGGEVWEELNLSNFPRNWVDGDQVRITTRLYVSTSGSLIDTDGWSTVMQFMITNKSSCNQIYKREGTYVYDLELNTTSIFNTPDAGTLISLNFYDMKGGNSKYYGITNNKLSNYTKSIKMWRLKK